MKWKLLLMSTPSACSAVVPFSDDEMRLVVAALKITNDLERIGDPRRESRRRAASPPSAKLQRAQVPEELAPMASAVRAMVSRESRRAHFPATSRWPRRFLKATTSSINTAIAFFEHLLQHMTNEPTLVSPGLAIHSGHAPTSNASPTTPTTLPRTSSSGFAAWDVPPRPRPHCFSPKQDRTDRFVFRRRFRQSRRNSHAPSFGRDHGWRD